MALLPRESRKWSDFRAALSPRLTQPLSSDSRPGKDSEKTVEDSVHMKKFSPLIALTLLTGWIALSPSTANAQDEKRDEFIRAWYATCYTEKNEDKCYQLSKELIAKYPDVEYAKNAKSVIKNKELNDAWQKFQAALD